MEIFLERNTHPSKLNYYSFSVFTSGPGLHVHVRFYQFVTIVLLLPWFLLLFVWLSLTGSIFP